MNDTTLTPATSLEDFTVGQISRACLELSDDPGMLGRILSGQEPAGAVLAHLQAGGVPAGADWANCPAWCDHRGKAMHTPDLHIAGPQRGNTVIDHEEILMFTDGLDVRRELTVMLTPNGVVRESRIAAHCEESFLVTVESAAALAKQLADLAEMLAKHPEWMRADVQAGE